MPPLVGLLAYDVVMTERVILRVSAPPIEQQIAAMAEVLDISATEAARRLSRALNSPLVESLHRTGP